MTFEIKSNGGLDVDERASRSLVYTKGERGAAQHARGPLAPLLFSLSVAGGTAPSLSI